MIAEVQFLLKFMLTSKKMGHKLYMVKRRKEYIENVVEMRNIDLNMEKYHNKLIGMINNRNLDGLSNELLLSESKVFSIHSFEPLLLQSIGTQEWIQAFEMFYSSLLHCSNVLHNIEHSAETTSFASKYIMHETGIQGRLFWGLNTENMKAQSKAFKLIEAILQSKHFGNITSESLLYDICKYNCYQYMKLLKQNYFDQQRNAQDCEKFKQILNYKHEDYGSIETPLMKLIKSVHCNDAYMTLFLSIQGMDLSVQDEDSQTAVSICKKRFKRKKQKKYNKWAKMIAKYQR